ncbi:MAG: ATP-binding protein [Candidatus Cloacimonetes bacterium]|nr:ATP-binding protein [Candidatus Cloacimonadota bacterium]
MSESSKVANRVSSLQSSKDLYPADLSVIAKVFFEYVRDIIYSSENATLDFSTIPEEFHDLGKGLNYLQTIIIETKAFTKELAKGNLDSKIPSVGNEIAAPLKTLHASLKHLTWQSQQVALGDYEQRVSYMGDFSDAFNNMILQLKQQRQIILAEKSTLKKYVEMMLLSITNPLLVFDKYGKLVYASNSWFDYFSEFTKDEISGKTIEELFSSNTTEGSLSEIVFYYLSANVNRNIQETVQDIDSPLKSSMRHFRMQFTPMFDNEVDISGVMVFLFDLTEIEDERRAAEQAREIAVQSLRVKSIFLAKMSHEMRTPLNAIVGLTEVILKKSYESIETFEPLSRILDSSSHLLNLIENILDLSKIETDSLELNLKEYETYTLILNTLNLNKLKYEKNTVDFILEVDPSLPKTMLGDALRIKQILYQLISNALKYTEKGFVKLKIAKISYDRYEKQQTELKKFWSDVADDQVVIKFVVEDSGTGINKFDLSTLFSEYSSYQNIKDRDSEGAGFGLNLSKKLAEIMGGYLTAESEFEKGSIFSLYLKQKRLNDDVLGIEKVEELQSSIYREKAQIESNSYQRVYMPYGKVLVVDDVEMNLYVAKKVMADYRLQIDTVLDGASAIEMIKNGKVYDVIFMDHMMPILDGMETTRLIRETGYIGIIIAFTAYAIESNDELYLQNGFDGFMAKPINTQILNNILNKYIRDRYPEEAKKYSQIEISTHNESEDTNQSLTLEHLDSKLVEIFVKDTRISINAINDSYQQRDYKMLQVNFHALKSMLASIGEVEKSKIAAKLEAAVQNNDMPFIDNNISDFIAYLEKLIKTLQEINKQEVANDEVIIEDTYLLTNQLEIIIEACQNYDDNRVFSAINLLKEYRWKSKTADSLEEIYNTIYLHSSFDKAEEYSNNLLIEIK